jgi:hypothetical protein
VFTRLLLPLFLPSMAANARKIFRRQLKERASKTTEPQFPSASALDTSVRIQS